MHPRKAIRASVKARLEQRQELKAAGVRVASSRARVTKDTRLPRCLIFLGDDDVDRLDSEAPREEVRTAPLRIAFQVDADTGDAGQDLLDDLAEVAEQTVMEDERHGGAAHKTLYQGTTATYEADADRILVGCVITWEVEFGRTYMPRSLPDAEGLDVGINVPSETEDQIEAEATVDLETT